MNKIKYISFRCNTFINKRRELKYTKKRKVHTQNTKVQLKCTHVYRVFEVFALDVVTKFSKRALQIYIYTNISLERS